MKKLNSINVFGEGSIVQGEYNKIRIFGEGEISGKVKCKFLKIMGECQAHDFLDIEKIRILGEAKIYNELLCRNLKVIGECHLSKISTVYNLKILGELISESNVIIKEKLRILGELNSKGNLRGNIVRVLGELNVKGDCESNIFYSKGRINLHGLLSADKIKIIPRHRSLIEEIGGSEIVIRENRFISFISGSVTSNIIEGDTIVLQNTRCKVVRGHNITILEDCIIDKIEYTGILKVDKRSTVGESICLKN